MKNKKKQHFKLWLFKAPFGLAFIGLGACLVAEAAMLKYSEANLLSWVSHGTIALVILNTGVCFVGDAVKHRVHYERFSEEH